MLKVVRWWGHFDRQGGGDDPTSWNSAHASLGCSQSDLEATGGDGLFYCFATNYECPYMDSSRFASKLTGQTWHDCIRISGLLSWHTLMPGHNGLFARQFPIALSYS